MKDWIVGNERDREKTKEWMFALKRSLVLITYVQQGKVRKESRDKGTNFATFQPRNMTWHKILAKSGHTFFPHLSFPTPVRIVVHLCIILVLVLFTRERREKKKAE